MEVELEEQEVQAAMALEEEPEEWEVDSEVEMVE